MSTNNRDYFSLEKALKGIGRTTFPQHQTMGKEYNYQAPDSVHKIPLNRLADFEPNFNSIILTKGVKLTDLISSAPICWTTPIVSEKLLNILIGHKLPLHSIYSVPILHDLKPVSGYYAIHFPMLDEHLQHVDYERSRFWIAGYNPYKKIEQIRVNSVDELHSYDLQSREIRASVRAEYFSMKSSFLVDNDLFPAPMFAFPLCLYVSNELRIAIISNRCTGMEFIHSHDRNKIWRYQPEEATLLWTNTDLLPENLS